MLDVVESNGLDDVFPSDDNAVDDVKGVIKECAGLRVRNGITRDSGSSVFVIDAGWLQMFSSRSRSDPGAAKGT